MATRAWGPLAVLSQSKRSQGSHEKGDNRGDKRGLVSTAVFGVLEVEKRSHEGCNCPTPLWIYTK